MISPMLAVVISVAGLPILLTIGLAFTNARLTGGLGSAHWAGLDNFAYALTDPDFLAAAGHTMHFTILSVGFEALFGVLVALLLNEDFRGRTLCRALLVLPWALPTIVNAIMWRLVYQPDFGVLNAVLTQGGVIAQYRSWLGAPDGAMNAVIVADVWKNYPLVTLIVLAALQGAPRDLYEAARLDGAKAWARFRTVTWPVIMPPLVVALVLRTIEALKVFDIVYVMTGGGPASGTQTVAFYTYLQAFSNQLFGYGAALAYLIVIAVGALAMFYLRVLRQNQLAGV